MNVRYRKRPVVVEAMLWTGENIDAIWEWGGAAGIYGPTEANPDQRDLYEELLDASCYIKQALIERDQNLETPDSDVVDAQVEGDEWLEFAVLLGADTADEEPTCLQTFDDDACAEELAQHVPGAWIGRRRVITEGWRRA